MDKITKYMMISFIANFFLSVFKIVFGIFTKTKSLIADGIHSFSDLITDLVGIVGNKLSKIPADQGHPKGHGKIEYITSLIISVFIITLAITIFKSSFTSSIVIPSKFLIIVVITTIIVKFFLSRFLIKKGKKLNNMILLSSGRESYTDVYSSVLVLVVIILSQFYNKISWLKYSDMVGSILISGLILFMGLKLLGTSLSLLVGEAENSSEIQNEVEMIILKRKEKFILEECMIYKLGSYYEVDLKILVDGDKTVREGHNLMDSIEGDLLDSNLNIEYVKTHIEPID